MINNPKDKRNWIKPGAWIMVITHHSPVLYTKMIALVLDFPKEDEVWVTYKTSPIGAQITRFKIDQVLVKDIIILNNCNGFDYSP